MEVRSQKMLCMLCTCHEYKENEEGINDNMSHKETYGCKGPRSKRRVGSIKGGLQCLNH